MVQPNRAWVLVSLALGAVACAAGAEPSTATSGAGGEGGSDPTGPTSGAGASGGDVGFDPNPCTPTTCEALGVDCGLQSDGCDDTIDCGGCPNGETCGGAGPSLCGVGPCEEPLTCEDLGATCGPQTDGCGGLQECGTCEDGQDCIGNPSECVDGCVPRTCEDQGYDCGQVADGCGGLTEDCGTCEGNDFCGGGGPNVCGSNLPPCQTFTCEDWGANCGPVSDGCGGLTEDCGECGGQDCCGCGGEANVCGGAPAACVPQTCDDVGANCGFASDGCGDLTEDCGDCTSGCCGCAAEPNVCGGGVSCDPVDCSAFPPGTCGQQSDGCGGLTDSCFTCPNGEFCGGGGPSVCGDGSTCINLQCQQVTCGGSATTSISGIVYDPAGNNPLPNVYVYVPNGTPAAFPEGASCDQCNTALTGLPLVTTLTDATGAFTLENMPVGPSIPVVIQLGKWRRQITVTTTSCTDTPVAADLSRFPRNQGEGDIPKIALATGGADSLECLLRKIGIDDSEFTNPSGSGRVNLFAGSPTNGPDRAASKYDAGLGGASFPSASTLWASAASLQAYDVVLLSCEGSTFSSTKPASALRAMFDYANNGGRVFASHYHYHWLNANTNGSGAARWSTLASWNTSLLYLMTINGNFYENEDVPEKVVTTFPKGNLLADWLVTTGASITKPNLLVDQPRHSVDSIDETRVLEWVYADTNVYDYDGNSQPTPAGHTTQYFTFNTPVQNDADDQCGRFVFSDIHVATGDKGASFPSECNSTTMKPQEKALEFMFFDLASAVCDEAEPPPECQPITCADQGIECGPAPDGCGGVIPSCGTCDANEVCSTGGQCAGSSCTPTDCAALGHECGAWSDGCGDVLQCGTCDDPDTCGGGGTPGECGSGSCTALTCEGLFYECGLWSDGCGGTLDCGTCDVPESCGGAGETGQCGGSGCTALTCEELGVLCGLSGDGCGGTIDCGECAQCVPLACGGRCGPQGDGCGDVIQCPACEGGCEPTNCELANADCGFFPNGCGDGLDCGPCPLGQICSHNECIIVN